MASATTASFSDNDVAILDTKRHNLIKRTLTDLRKAIWQDATFESLAEFMKDAKEWSNTVKDENFKKAQFQSQVDSCSNFMSALKADPGNCDIHINLLKNYVELRELTPENNNEFKELQKGFTDKLENVIKSQREQLYAKLSDEMDTFIKDLSEAEKEHARDIIEWYEQFNSEKDFYAKQHMALDYPRLFSKKHLSADTTCIPSSVLASMH